MNTGILYITHALNGLLMVAMPIGLGLYLTRKLSLSWRLFWIGGAVFILSQVGHIPFNVVISLLFQRGVLPAPTLEWRLPFNAIFLGISAGLFEEGARYLMYRYWTKEARWWGQGVLLGAGHGGAEAIILGVLVILTYLNMVAYQSAGLPGLSPAVAAAVQQYWSAAWPMTLLGAVERLFTLPAHMALSALVLQTFIRRQPRWLGLAIVWHALMDGLVVVMIGQGYGPYVIEAVIGISALINLGIIFALRQPRPKPTEEPESVTLSLPSFVPLDVAETPENLDKSRFQ